MRELDLIDAALVLTVVLLGVLTAAAVAWVVATVIRAAWEERRVRRLARQLATEAAEQLGVVVIDLDRAEAEWDVARRAQPRWQR